MNASFKPSNLATKNALDVTTAWLEANPAPVILLTAKPAFQESLKQRLSITSNLSLLTVIETGEKPFSLLLAQPAEKDLALIEHLLNNPHLCQVIHLQSTWIGHRLLPEWRPTHQNTVIKTINHRMADWIFEDRSIGNLQSLLWGFLSGRMLALNRPDLMDHCAARMRRHLFPAARPAALAYLRVLRWVKEHPNR